MAGIGSIETNLLKTGKDKGKGMSIDIGSMSMSLGSDATGTLGAGEGKVTLKTGIGTIKFNSGPKVNKAINVIR